MIPPVPYQLEKWEWTEADFGQMGWHDSAVYTWQLQEQQLLLDLDYIFQWNASEVEGLPFTFWVAPATLAFANVRNVAFDLDFSAASSYKEYAAELESVERDGNCWTLQFQHGYCSFEADGFTQYIRQAPSFEFSQQVGYQQRGGNSVSIESELFDKQDFNLLDLVASESWRLYQVAIERARVKRNLDKLLDERTRGEVELKEFLLRRRDFQDRINYLGIELRATQFENW